MKIFFVFLTAILRFGNSAPVDFDHSMKFEETKTLYHSNRTEQRLFLEAWATNDATLNRATHTALNE